MRGGILFIIVYIGLVCDATAWGPAAHAYIASRVMENQEADIIFGAILPDCTSLILNHSTLKSRYNHLTHFESERLPPSPFAMGFMTHNGAWGADYYAHLYYHPEADEIWSTRKYRQLSDEFGITMQHAEDIIEMCVDIQVRLLMGPSFGSLIASAAEASGPAHEEAMVDAFADPLAAQIEGLSLEEAARKIRFTVKSHRMATITFGRQLEKGREEIFEAIPIVLAFYFGCDKEMATGYFQRGMEITADFEVEFDRICTEIKGLMPVSNAAASTGESRVLE